MKKAIILLASIPLLISSCSIEKRRYTGGYCVEWHKTSSPTKESPTLTASIYKSLPITIKPIAITDSTLCDEITLLNGTLLKGKVEEIGTSEIKYKDCDNLNGPVIDIEKSTVFVIRYANGKRTVINTANTQPATEDDYKLTKEDTALTPEQQKFVAQYAQQNGINNNSNLPTNGKGLATAALICGLVSLVAYYGVFVLALLALIFGGSAMARINRSGDNTGKGSATAGIVLGILGLSIWVFVLFLL